MQTGEEHTGKDYHNKPYVTRPCPRCRLFSTVTSLLSNIDARLMPDIERDYGNSTMEHKRSMEEDFRHLFATLGNDGAMDYLETQLNLKHFLQLQDYFNKFDFNLDFQWCR